MLIKISNTGQTAAKTALNTETSQPSRRAFLGGAGTFVVGMTLLAACGPKEKLSLDFPTIEAFAGPSPLAEVTGGDASPSLFISIAPDNRVQITCHRSEMGQQTWTSMTQIIADELEADWDDIDVVQAIGHPMYGDQNTDGSRSVRNNFHRLRVAGAAMRTMLERAAATAWQVDVGECTAKLGMVYHAQSKKKASFGQLAEFAAKLPIPAEADIVLKDRKNWRYIGTAAKSFTVPKIVQGQGIFGQDVRKDGMVYAVIARPPQIGGSVRSYDDAASLKITGVISTHEMPKVTAPVGFNPLGGVAVIASDTWAAIQGRKALEINWDKGPNAGHDSASFAKKLLKEVRKPARTTRSIGDTDAALAKAHKTITAEYQAAHLSQSPMEPPAATAIWHDADGDSPARIECWACVQAPQATRDTVAQAVGLKPDQVTINITLLGGGFGRKSKPDFVAEAAILAKALKKPVKVIWTREDDLGHGYLHSVSAQHLEAGFDKTGKATAFLHRTAFPTITSIFAPASVPPAFNPSNGELALGASDTPFQIPNLRLEAGQAKAHLRIGWLRSVCNVFHAFAVQSFAAEMAHAQGKDAKDYLLELYGEDRHVDPNQEGIKYGNYGASLDEFPIDTARLKNVTREAAKLAGWGRELPLGHGIGIATHRSFLTYVSTVVEVLVGKNGLVKLIGVWSVMDAGTVVNTNHVVSQLEGGTLYGLSNALYGQITAKDGVVEQTNFPDWRVMRMAESPRIFKTKIIASNAPPGGVGEPATPPAAPALANAIFDASGIRVRSLPMIGPGRDTLPL